MHPGHQPGGFRGLLTSGPGHANHPEGTLAPGESQWLTDSVAAFPQQWKQVAWAAAFHMPCSPIPRVQFQQDSASGDSRMSPAGVQIVGEVWPEMASFPGAWPLGGNCGHGRLRVCAH